MTILIICIAAVAIVLLIAYKIYRVVFYAPPARRKDFGEPLVGTQYEAVAEDIYRIGHIMQRYPCERIERTSFDGYQLIGRYYHIRDDAPLEILFHGYRSCTFRDCAGCHALARKLGFNVLAVEQRAHGESGSNTIAFGILERHDCLQWVQYATDRFGSDVPIILSGLSMGAATVLMSAGLNLPPNVACIIADSPYSSPCAIIEKVCHDLRYPVALCRPFLHLAARIFGHFSLHSASAKEAVAQSRIPMLLLHGEADQLVPCSMSAELYASNPEMVTLHTFPDAGHCLCYLVDPIRYEKVVYDFLQTIPQIASQISENFTQQKYET